MNHNDDLSRRAFVAASVAAGLAARGGAASAAGPPVAENDVTIKMPDGDCDAAFIHPESGSHPGVLIWADAFGLRASLRDIARRLAAEGYAVLVPNLYYRVSKAPQWQTARDVNFSDAAFRAKLAPLRTSVTAAGAAEKDAAAYVSFLDAQEAVDRKRKVGVQGYCMGGSLALRSAAAVPQRIGATASFHGGGLVDDTPDSPHLLAPKIKGGVLIAIGRNDDQKQPDAKVTLKQAFDAAKVPAEVEVYAANHGWCISDMPNENGAPIYNAAEAERAFGKLLVLYKQYLA